MKKATCHFWGFSYGSKNLKNSNSTVFYEIQKLIYTELSFSVGGVLLKTVVYLWMCVRVWKNVWFDQLLPDPGMDGVVPQEGLGGRPGVHLTVSFRQLCLVTVSLPLCALVLCFITAYIFQPDEIHETHCRVSINIF